VGAALGAGDGEAVGAALGAGDGEAVGAPVGEEVDSIVGRAVGLWVTAHIQPTQSYNLLDDDDQHHGMVWSSQPAGMTSL
jgi:outer membrane lipoprotein SlyB